MLHLLVVSLIWAFSFGLTKGRLAGLDSGFVSAARLGLALVVFLPALRLRGLGWRVLLELAGIGAVQFGLMYLALNASYRHLAAHEIVLLTLTTPLFVTLFADAFERRFHPRGLLAALLAVVAAGVVVFRAASVRSLEGVVLVQLANAAFAFGQVVYRRRRPRFGPGPDRAFFGVLYLGAFVLTLPFALAGGGAPALTGSQLATLLYLGVLASGLGFFGWNLGAARVRPETLAVFNNAKVPLGVLASLTFFGEQASLARLAIGGALFALAARVARFR